MNLSDFINPRSALARPDLAEQVLDGLVPAAAYLATKAWHGCGAVCDVFEGPEAGAVRISQLLAGEVFDVLDRFGDRLWGRCRRDGEVGWIAEQDLSPGAPLATHRVASVEADLPLNALVVSRDGDDRLAPIGDFERDPVEVAERLLGRPHAPGARSSVSTDCSGLVQQALLACGLPGPRRAADQAELGHAVDRAEARRGDLVVWLSPQDARWTGHSGLMLDPDTVLHATGFHGAVVTEPFDVVEARCLADGDQPAIFRRL
ncbi:glycoside hydrolase [Brevundimonas sp. Leaf363]|uniref:C40 family peptidase n=1 Tax=Brevundimonas sp. Leaf363 TaxID=1736353 RepID=UPI0006FC1584|nr:NlpC/P60 family protein [Brevundimonas sp. Leaf363]KQS57436.1 glycoside hydrolase [Brevundimonas sp. Leaf363]